MRQIVDAQGGTGELGETLSHRATEATATSPGLVKRRKLVKEFKVPCLIVVDAVARTVSRTENVERETMQRRKRRSTPQWQRRPEALRDHLTHKAIDANRDALAELVGFRSVADPVGLRPSHEGPAG